MGVGKMGKLPILLPRQPVHQFPREKAYLGEKVTLEKKELGVTCILRARDPCALGVGALCEKGWTVTKERCGFLAAVDQD